MEFRFAAIVVGLMLAVQASPASAHDCLDPIVRWPYGVSKGVAVEGNRAVFGDGAVVQVLDLTAPSAPVVVGEVDLFALVQNVSISGTLAFVVADDSLHVIDLQGPDPTVLGSVAGVGRGSGIDATSGFVSIVSYRRFMIVDVSNPTAPVVRGQIEWSSGQPQDLRLHAGYAYVADQEVGLRVIDIADPDAPVEINSLGLGAGVNAERIDIAGGFAYVVGWTSIDRVFVRQLFVIDLDDPGQPVLAASPTVGGSDDVAVAQGLAFIAGGGTVFVYGVTNPPTVDALGQTSLPFFPYAYYTNPRLAAVDDHVLFTAEETGLDVVDATNPTAPVPVAAVGGVGSIEDAALNDGMLAIAAGDRGLRMVDVSNPAEPVELGFGPSPPQYPVWGIDIADSIVYVGTFGGEGFKTVDISDPGHPVTLGSVAGVAGNWVTVSGDRGYVVNEWGGQLFVVDVTSPAAPALQGSLTLPPGEWKWPVVIGDHVFLRNNSDNQVIGIDASDPTMPFHALSIDVVVGVGSLAASGSWLLVPDALDLSTPVVRFFDLRDPAHPVEIAPYLTTGGPAGEIEVVGTVAYLSIIDVPGYFEGAIEAVGIGDPRTPVFMGRHPWQEPVTRMTSDEDTVFVLDQERGFNAFALCHGPIFADGFESGDTSAWATTEG